MLAPEGGKQRTIRAHATNGLRVAGPLYDPCFMPLGHAQLCMLPGNHPSSASCLPKPATYPPTVVVAEGQVSL